MHLFRFHWAVALLCGWSLHAHAADDKAPIPAATSVTRPAAEQAAETADDKTEDKNTVYSLRDYENGIVSDPSNDPGHETDSDYKSSYNTDSRDAYAAEDGIQRSLEGPDVVITAGTDRTVYEYRQNGQLRMVKIIPRVGRPYYLVPADQTRGYGDLSQADMLLPQWTIIEF